MKRPNVLSAILQRFCTFLPVGKYNFRIFPNAFFTDDKINAAQEPSSDNLKVNGTADGGSVQGKRKRSKEAEDDLLYSDDENQQNTVSQDDDNDEILLGDEDEGGRNWRT